MSLELESFETAVTALKQVFAKSEDKSFMASLDSVAQHAIRSGAIQHFEVTYELCWKLMKRWLESNVSPGMAEGVTRREFFRLAAEQRLISDVERWMHYHAARNETSHTYNEPTAEKVYSVIRDFVEDADALLATLKARNNRDSSTRARDDPAHFAPACAGM